MASKVITRWRNRPRSKVHHKRKPTISLAVAAGFIPLVMDTVRTVKDPNQGFGQVPHVMAWHLGGYNTWDGTFSFDRLVKGWTPIAGGILVHKGANWLGINRMLARMGIPFIRL